MKIEIVQKTDNKLLGRKEIEAKAVFSGATPKNEDIQKVLAAELGVDKDLVVIEHNYNIYGAQAADIFAKVYNNKKGLEKYEVSQKKSEGTPKEGEAPTPTAPAEAQAAEKPAGAEPAPEAEAPVEEKPAEAPAEKLTEEKKEEKKEAD